MGHLQKRGKTTYQRVILNVNSVIYSEIHPRYGYNLSSDVVDSPDFVPKLSNVERGQRLDG